MIYARITDGKTFAQAISFDTPTGLRTACKEFFRQRYNNAELSTFEVKKWLNVELREIDNWLAEKTNQPGRSVSDINSLSMTAAKWRNDRKNGLKHGTQQIDTCGIAIPLELQVFDQHCGLDIERMIDKSEAWVAAGGYSSDAIPETPCISDGCDSNISITSLMAKRITDRIINIKLWMGRSQPATTDIAESCIGTSDPIEAWTSIYNKCQTADRHAEALSVFCKNLCKFGEPTPQERRNSFTVINGENP